MSMRPSPRVVLMTPPPPLGDLILGRLGGTAQALTRLAGFTVKTGPRAIHRPATGPGQFDQPGWERCSNFNLRQAVDGINPLDARLAQLARAIALVHRVERPPLARAAVLDVGVRGE